MIVKTGDAQILEVLKDEFAPDDLETKNALKNLSDGNKMESDGSDLSSEKN